MRVKIDVGPFAGGIGFRRTKQHSETSGHAAACPFHAVPATYAAGVGLSCARSLAGTRCEPGSRRSDQSEYPSHARPNPTGTAASGANDCGSSANAGDDTAPKPSRPAAQRDRMPPRNVAMPNSTFPRMNTNPSSDQSVARAPTLVSPPDPVKIPRKLSANFGESVARSGKIKASKKVKPVTNTNQRLNRGKPARPNQPATFACLA